MGDVKVRQAINYALDRKSILEQLQLGYGTVTNQVFGPDSGAYVDELDESYPYDPEKARNSSPKPDTQTASTSPSRRSSALRP